MDESLSAQALMQASGLSAPPEELRQLVVAGHALREQVAVLYTARVEGLLRCSRQNLP